MRQPLVHTSVPSVDRLVGKRAGYHERSSSTRTARLMHMLGLWIARRRQRSDLRELMEGNRDLLKDIGISQEDARQEAAKPFWR